jgi:hypothetical protein
MNQFSQPNVNLDENLRRESTEATLLVLQQQFRPLLSLLLNRLRKENLSLQENLRGASTGLYQMLPQSVLSLLILRPYQNLWRYVFQVSPCARNFRLPFYHYRRNVHELQQNHRLCLMILCIPR